MSASLCWPELWEFGDGILRRLRGPGGRLILTSINADTDALCVTDIDGVEGVDKSTMTHDSHTVFGEGCYAFRPLWKVPGILQLGLQSRAPEEKQLDDDVGV